MKATDFNLSKDIVFNFEKGMTSFKNTRLVVFDADAIGLLRHSIFKELGLEKTRSLFFKFGYQHGFADFLQMKTNYEFDSEMDLLASGPVIHTWEGIVQATPREIKYNRETGEFYFTGVWNNSYEAQQYLSYNEKSHEPVCWTIMGYASGWCTAFFGKKLLAVEPLCMGKGDDHCEWLIQPPSAWDDRAKHYLPIINEL